MEFEVEVGDEKSGLTALAIIKSSSSSSPDVEGASYISTSESESESEESEESEHCKIEELDDAAEEEEEGEVVAASRRSWVCTARRHVSHTFQPE